MQQLKIETANALTAYKQADDSGKLLLENLFGKTIFNRPLKEVAQTFDGVLSLRKAPDENEQIILNYAGVNRSILASQALLKFDMMNEVISEGVKLDWGDARQPKHYAWFDVVVDKSKPTGFGLSLIVVSCTRTDAFVGARLCFPEEWMVKWAVEYYLDLYELILLK